MPSLRSTFRSPALTAAALLLALAAVAPAAGAATPVARIKAKVSPSHLPIALGTSMTLTLDTSFASDPPGGNFVLQHTEYLFGGGVRFNGKLFPSCSVARLQAARGMLGTCPEGSKIGSGTATGTATAIGVSSTGKVTLFNGPGGRSLTMNISVLRPAAINATFAAPLVRLRGGRYKFKISVATPPSLQTVLDGDIVVSRIAVTTGATYVIGGVRRGYYEVTRCPKNGSAIHGDFTFNQGGHASADTSVVC